MQKRQPRRVQHVDEEGQPYTPTGAFGGQVTTAHKVNIEKNEGSPYFTHEYGKGNHMLVMLDMSTQWLQA